MQAFAILLLTTSMLLGCNKGTPAEPPKNVSDTRLDGELKVMTSEDMNKLQEERRDMINRPTPLGEEKDAVEALRKQAAEK